MASMKGICPICFKVGYLILEKPRVKDHKLYERHRRNKPSKSYDTRRSRRRYFRFSHYDSNPCYIGCLAYAIKKLERVSEIFENEMVNDEFRKYVLRVKGGFKNYIPNPKDAQLIHDVIKESHRYSVIFNVKSKKYEVFDL